MHSRHRSPGGGGFSRSNNNNNNNSMGMGGGGLVTGRMSPEMYNSGYNRNFNNNNNRSFNGRMVSNNNNRPYPPALPPQQQQQQQVRRSSGDILMEAGRLAAEYLVSQGVLPPNVLTEKWGNGNMLGGDGRGSVLNRLGNGGSDFGGGGGSGGRRVRGRRKTGFSSTRGFDSEWGRDVRNNNDQMSPNMEYGDDSVSGQWHHEERQGDFDGTSGVSKPGSNDLPLKSDVVGNLEMEVDKSEVPDDAGSKGSTSTTGKEVPCETDHRFSNASDDVNISNTETGETKDAVINDGLEKETALEDFSVDHLSKEDDTSKNSNDLLQLGSSSKVSTKAGSSLAVKDSNVEPVIMAGEFQACDISTTKGPKVSKGEDPTEETKHFEETKRFDSDDSKAPLVQTMEDVGVLGSALETERGDAVMSRSLLDRSVMYDQESEQNLFELGSSNSVVKDRGEKRFLEDEDIREGSKKAREWPSTEVSRPNDYLQLHNFGANPSDLHRSSAPDLEVVEFVDQERLFDVALLPRGAPESGTESKEEKQLFPSSFKICDLNLMESSDMTETHDGRPLFGLSSTMEAKKGLQVDVDLSMSNGCQRSDNYDGSAADAKKPIIVEVEDDSPKEHEVFDHSERKTDIAHSSLDGFPNHMDDTGDLPDAQDGYGLMISELLGNDISNCSSVPADMTSMHNEMGLHNAVEILDDDDPIYLSLGEIPISFLGVWEQPTQPFGKPF